MALTEERVDELFDRSELCYQVKKYFDSETCEEMIEELKDKIKAEL